MRFIQPILRHSGRPSSSINLGDRAIESCSCGLLILTANREHKFGVPEMMQLDPLALKNDGNSVTAAVMVIRAAKEPRSRSERRSGSLNHRPRATSINP
jgi:hypothetical protein